MTVPSPPALASLKVQAPAGPLVVELFQPGTEPAGSGGTTPLTGPVPGVVMIHDALGVGSDTRRLAQKVADRGYLVALPDLYARGGLRKCLISTFRALIKREGAAMEDLAATREALAADPRCSGKTAVTGFCMGGGFALLFAPKGFDVSAPFYSSLPPKDLERALTGSCPLVGSYGERDLLLKGFGPKLEAALDSLGVEHDVKTYPGAGHSFANQFPQPLGALAKVTGFGYAPEQAADAWRRVFAFFEEHLY